MRKIDLHIHTCPTISDRPFVFSLEALQQYVSNYHLDAIAITNHNVFNESQFQEIRTTLSIPVFPGIEVDIESGHLLVISDLADIDDFVVHCNQIWHYNNASRTSRITEDQFISAFPDYKKYILIPHYDKSPTLDLERVPHLRSCITCGEVSSVKKFITQKKRTDDLVPILFSDWRSCAPLENLDDRQTYIDIEDISLSALKYALTDREKVSIDPNEGHTIFQVLDNGLRISTGLTVVLGKRSSGKSYTLQQIANQFENKKHIQQFALLSKNIETDQTKFNESLQQKGSAVAERFLIPFKAVVDDVQQIDLEQDDKSIDEYLSSLKKVASEASRQDIYSKASLYQESLYGIKELKTLIELIDAADLLLHNVEYRPLIQRHIDFASLRALSVELKKQYISEQTLNAQMNYANAIITTVKKELRVHSSATSIPDIDFYAISMNKYKIERFKEVAQLVKQERIIQQRLLYSYQIVVDAGPFNSVRDLQKIKHSKAAMSESFALYDDPYSFLKNLRSRGDIASSEFNLLQELNEVTSSEILILDEPESSFDNLFLKDGVDALLKDISRRIPVVIATHNNTIGLSVHPDYIIYTEKEILEDGTQKFHTYAGSSSSPELIDLDGNRISKQQILLDCLEAGKDAYMDRRSSYEIFSN